MVKENLFTLHRTERILSLTQAAERIASNLRGRLSGSWAIGRVKWADSKAGVGYRCPRPRLTPPGSYFTAFQSSQQEQDYVLPCASALDMHN